MTSGPASRGVQQQQQQQVQEEEEAMEESEDVKTEGLLRSRKAVLPSEIRRRERSTEDPRRGRGDDEVGTSRLQSFRDVEAEELGRGGFRGGRGRWDEAEHAARTREQEHATYVHKAHRGSSAPSAAVSRQVSGAGDARMINQRNVQDNRDGFSNGESHQDTRGVSVAQLRHSYMESATTPPTSRRNNL